METYADSWIEEGLQQGLQTGMQQGLQQGLQTGFAKSLLVYLEWRFGQVDEEVKRHVGTQSPETLERLQRAAFAFTKLDDLTEWLKKEAV